MKVDLIKKKKKKDPSFETKFPKFDQKADHFIMKKSSSYYDWIPFLNDYTGAQINTRARYCKNTKKDAQHLANFEKSIPKLDYDLTQWKHNKSTIVFSVKKKATIV